MNFFKKAISAFIVFGLTSPSICNSNILALRKKEVSEIEDTFVMSNVNAKIIGKAMAYDFMSLNEQNIQFLRNYTVGQQKLQRCVFYTEFAQELFEFESTFDNQKIIEAYNKLRFVTNCIEDYVYRCIKLWTYVQNSTAENLESCSLNLFEKINFDFYIYIAYNEGICKDEYETILKFGNQYLYELIRSDYTLWLWPIVDKCIFHEQDMLPKTSDYDKIVEIFDFYRKLLEECPDYLIKGQSGNYDLRLFDKKTDV